MGNAVAILLTISHGNSGEQRYKRCKRYFPFCVFLIPQFLRKTYPFGMITRIQRIFLNTNLSNLFHPARRAMSSYFCEFLCFPCELLKSRPRLTETIVSHGQKVLFHTEITENTEIGTPFNLFNPARRAMFMLLRLLRRLGKTIIADN